MSKRIKELTEKRGAKLEEARAIVESASAEERDLSAEELGKVEAIHDEAENLVRSIQVESKQIAEEGRKFEDLSAVEKRDVAQFDLGRLLSRLATNQPLEGAEAEFAAEGEAEARAAGISPRGVMVSRLALNKRDMTATLGSGLDQGGMTIETGKTNLLDDLFNRSVLVQAGATVLNGLTGNVDVPRLVKGTAPAKKTENQQAAEYTATTTQLSLSPNRLPTVIEVSNQLLKQSSTNALQTVIERHLESYLMQVMQIGLLHGAGTTEPVGVAGTTGIGSVAGGTLGGAPDWGDIVNLQREVAVDDANFGSLGFITNPKVEAKLKTTAKISSTDSMTIIDPRWGNTIDGRPYYISNSVSSALTKSSTTGLSAMFYGNWQDLWIANWGGIEFLVNPYSKDDYGLTRINASVYYDGGVVRPQSFSAMLDAVTT